MRIISYKRLWKLLVDKNMSKVDLRRRADVSSYTMTKLSRNESVSLELLLKICNCLDCSVGDICDFVKVDNDLF